MSSRTSHTPNLSLRWSVASVFAGCSLVVACGESSDETSSDTGANFHLIEALPEHEAQANDDEVVWTSLLALDGKSLRVVAYSGWGEEHGFGAGELIRWSPEAGSHSLGLLPDTDPASGRFVLLTTTTKADVVWGYWTDAEREGGARVFRADDDGLQEIDPPRALGFSGAFLSEDGSVALIAAGDSRANYCWRWTLEGSSQILETLPGLDNSNPLFLSADGKTVLGYGFTPMCSDNGLPCEERAEHFRWTEADGIEGLGVPDGTMCDEGDVTLTSRGPILATQCDGRGYLWSETDGWISLCEDDACGSAGFPSIHRISGDGSTVFGTSLDEAGELIPWRWTETAGLKDLELPDDYLFGNYSWVNDDGSIIMGDLGIDGHSRGFRWSLREGFRIFEPLMGDDSMSLSGARSNGSRVIGTSYDSSSSGGGTFVFWHDEARMTIAEALATADAAPGAAKIVDAGFFWNSDDPVLVGTATVNGQSLAWVAPLDR